MLADLRAVLRGTGASLASDPLFREASAAVPAGWTRLDFSRPGVEGAAGAALWRGLVESKWAADQFPPEGRQVFAALMTATEEACRWAGACRAEVTATYSDAARPAVTAALMDPEREKAPPRIDMGPAPLLAPRILPARTLLVAESRVDAGAAAEEFVKAFLRALPGGRATWNDLWKDQEENRTLLEGRLEALVAGARGETGIAVLAPAPRDPPEGPPGIGPLLDRLPSLVLFAQYRDAGAAFDAALETLRDAASAVGTDPEAFAAGRKRYDRGRGSRPFGTSVETGDVGGASVATLRFFWSAAPGADLDGTGVSVVRRGDLLFLVAGGPAAQDLAVATDGGPGTLADAVRTALPADFLPAESASLLLFREDGVAESLGTLLDLLVPVGPQLTLQGYAGEPPEDRVRAHAEGWRQAIDLVEDALRTGCWRGAARVREGDRWITVHRRAAEKGPPR
jgi:hypothetical protein